MLCVMTACHAHFAIFSFYAHFAIFCLFKKKLLKTFISASNISFKICSYFSGDLSLAALIKCVLNNNKKKTSVGAKFLPFLRLFL